MWLSPLAQYSPMPSTTLIGAGKLFGRQALNFDTLEESP